MTDGGLPSNIRNNDRFGVGINQDYELLVRPFTSGAACRGAGRRLRIHDGPHRLQDGHAAKGVRCVLLSSAARSGNSHAPGLSVSGSRLNLSPQVSLEPSSRSTGSVCRPEISRRPSRVRASPLVTPLLFASALVSTLEHAHGEHQRRMRWGIVQAAVLHRLQRGATATRPQITPGLFNRSIIVKVRPLPALLTSPVGESVPARFPAPATVSARRTDLSARCGRPAGSCAVTYQWTRRELVRRRVVARYDGAQPAASSRMAERQAVAARITARPGGNVTDACRWCSDGDRDGRTAWCRCRRRLSPGVTLPMLLFLHGATQNGAGMLRPLGPCRRHGIVIVAPTRER